MSETVFIRLLSHADKAGALAEAVEALSQGHYDNTVVHVVNADSIRKIPGSPFAYWVRDRVRRLFRELPPFESEAREARRGASTGDDGRRVRATWEVAPGTIRIKRWVPFSKGGSFSPFYSDVHLLVGWDELRQTFEGFYGRTGRMVERPEALGYFFRPGLTWSRRSQRGLSLRVLPAGCVFADKGPSAFAPTVSLLPILALTNSTPFQTLVSLQMAFGSYEVGVIQRTPVPDLKTSNGDELGRLAREALGLKRELDTATETSHVFKLPAVLQISIGSLAENVRRWQSRLAEADCRFGEYQQRIDEIAFQLYGIEDSNGDCAALEDRFCSPDAGDEGDDDVDVESPPGADQRLLISDLFSYVGGCPFGRWDVRFATSECQPHELPDAFATLPVCSPAMLQGLDGLPASETPAGYPLRIDWDGILVDDPGQAQDIVRSVRDVLELIWKDRAEAIEQEACEILGVEELRDYFRKPGKGGFWDDHVARYSKSRRKAPIYWLLQSKAKNYALWLYYHRLDKDLLLKALVNYVEPKVKRETNRLVELRQQKQAGGLTGKPAKKLDKEIERQEDLISELRDFEDNLRRAANLHLEPDLNDGVVLNIAPLWELVPWKEAKKYWGELMEGKYEWSTIGKQLREKGLVR